MIVAVDYDQMITAFPEYFKVFFSAMQKAGNKIGVLSGRKESERNEIEKTIDSYDIEPDFCILMTDDIAGKYPVGIFKAKVCNYLGVDVLYDDFQYSDHAMLSDFFSINSTTIPMTSFAYQPESEEE